MKALFCRVRNFLSPRALRLSAEDVEKIAKQYLSEQNRALPENTEIRFFKSYNEWRILLEPGMRPGRWLSVSDETGEVTGYFNPPR